MPDTVNYLMIGDSLLTHLIPAAFEGANCYFAVFYYRQRVIEINILAVIADNEDTVFLIGDGKRLEGYSTSANIARVQYRTSRC